jgi:hypothetical protein
MTRAAFFQCFLGMNASGIHKGKNAFGIPYFFLFDKIVSERLLAHHNK